MKFNKLFFAAVAFAALAMVGCKKSQNEPTPTPDPTPEPEIELPEIAAPEAGKTTIAIYAEVCPKGAYLVGSNQGYNVSDDALSFEAIEGAEHWYKLTIDYVADLQAKVIARPSDPDVAFSWSYQWGKNYDPEDENCELKSDEENNVIILQGQGSFVFENGGQPKLAEVADGGVVYIWIKNWAASPVIEAKKLETAWVKSDFFSADLEKYEWGWHEMTPKGDGVFEFEGIWGGSGCNIAETEGGADNWYPTDNEAVTLVGEPAKGDKVLVTFTSEKMTIGKLEIKLLEKGEKPELEFMDITVTGINVPEAWEHCYIWAWNDDDANYTGGIWPGEELEISSDRIVSRAFEQVAKPLKVIFSNGDGAQTNDIVIESEVPIDVTANLK